MNETIYDCVSDYVENPAAEMAAGLSLYHQLGGNDKLLILLCNTVQDDFARRKLNTALMALAYGPAPVVHVVANPVPPEVKPIEEAVQPINVQLDAAIRRRADLYVMRAKQSHKLVQLVEAALHKDTLIERQAVVAEILRIDAEYVEAKRVASFIEKNGFNPSVNGEVKNAKIPNVLKLNLDLPAHTLRQQLSNLRSNLSKWKKDYEGMNKAHPQALDLEEKIKKGFVVKAKLEHYFKQMG